MTLYRPKAFIWICTFSSLFFVWPTLLYNHKVFVSNFWTLIDLTQCAFLPRQKPWHIYNPPCRVGYPPIHLHLIFEISSLKNQFRRTGFFCRFRTRFLLPLLGKTVIVEPNQSVKHELKMCARCLSTSFLSDLFT